MDREELVRVWGLETCDGFEAVADFLRGESRAGARWVLLHLLASVDRYGVVEGIQSTAAHVAGLEEPPFLGGPAFDL